MTFYIYFFSYTFESLICYLNARKNFLVINKPCSKTLYSFLFWSDTGTKLGPKIERATLDGKNRLVLTRDVGRPIALSADYDTQRIFWLDDKRQTLESFLSDGSERDTFDIGIELSFIVVYGV